MNKLKLKTSKIHILFSIGNQLRDSVTQALIRECWSGMRTAHGIIECTFLRIFLHTTSERTFLVRSQVCRSVDKLINKSI